MSCSLACALALGLLAAQDAASEGATGAAEPAVAAAAPDAAPGAALEAALDAEGRAVLELGRRCAADFYEGELDDLWARFTPEMRGALGERTNLGTFREQTEEQLGEELQVVDESVVTKAGFRTYRRKSRFAGLETLIELLVSLDDDDRVAGFSIQPVRTEALSDYLEYETKTPLQLPFEGEWVIFWGGRELEDNYHAFTRDQRFAYDILMMEDGKTHRGAGEACDDYHCWDAPVLAPATGVVVSSANDVEDNEPGVLNPRRPLGNHVILDHGNGEYSFLAHFREGSLQVDTGDRVEAGQLLGRCGNSGNTTEPHIHYHLQDSPTFGKGQGMPTQFLDYVADGETVTRGEPTRAQRVRNRYGTNRK